MSIGDHVLRGFLLFLVSGFSSPLFFQNPTASSMPFLVTMGESWSSPQPSAGPINAMNCVIVFPSGRIHMELRRQEFFKQQADLGVFESSLDANEMQMLRGLLDAEAIKRLPPFAFLPTLLAGSSDVQRVFSARIPRGTERQQAGYFIQHKPALDDAESEPTKAREAETALRPLVEWFRALKSSKPRNWRHLSNAKSNLCEP